MLGTEDKKTKVASSFPSSFSLVCCRNGFSSTQEKPNNEKVLDKSCSESTHIKKPGGWRAMPFILGNESFERLAAFGLFANFMVYLTREFHLDQVTASNILNIWSGVTNFLPLLGAFISDAYVGRFKTIAFASFFSLLGMMSVTLTAWLPNLHPPSCTPNEQALNECVKANRSHVSFLIMGLFLLSIGSAGIRPCSIPFGVDQFDPTTNEGKKGINSFFNWYYTSFTLVLLITQTVVVYIQDTVSWKYGFAIPTFCMFLSIILFFIGTKIYVHVKPHGSIFSSIGQVIVACYRKRNLKLPCEKQLVVGKFYDPPLNGIAAFSKLPFTNQFRFLNKGALIMEGEINQDGSIVNEWKIVSIQQVEEVKCLLRIFPIWAAGILGFTAMAQQGTFTVSQALKMDRHLGPKFQVPAGSLSVISLVVIGLWVPFYDRVCVPSLRKVTKHEGGITLLQRIGIGMVFSVLSMIVAGLVEKARRDTTNSNPSPLGIAPMSVFWLAPQLILLGLCEAFNIIGLIEFFNRQFPEHMRSIANALFSCSFALANYVSSILVTTVHHATKTKSHPDWLTNDINAGRLDYFYYLLAGVGVLNLIYFLYVSHGYHYKRSVEIQEQDQVQEMELGSKGELDYSTTAKV